MKTFEIWEKIEIPSLRYLLDSPSHEYNSMKMEEKLSVLSRMILFDVNLNEIIKEYNKR